MVRRRGPGSRRTALALVALLAVGGSAGLAAPAAQAVATAVTVSPTGTVVVTLRGNGHGHGMSQYGAQGAAATGRTYQQIAAFYYPRSTLATSTRRFIRVRISGAGTTTTVRASTGLLVTGVKGVLPTTDVWKYRLIADTGSGLTLQRRGPVTGGKWATVAAGLPDRADFHRTNWASVRAYFTDGTSTAYFGRLRAVRASTTGTTHGVRTVNVLTLERYTAGVVPREMPASWRPAALAAQAVAARTYAAYEMAHPLSRDYDICDTTMCQVYGGHVHFAADNTIAWTDDPAPAAATAGKILVYQGAPIFAQFSASNGGYTVAGGQPYLPARADSFDPDVKVNANPYIAYSKTVAVKAIARRLGLATVTAITISQRDGKGAWGGRVLAGSVTGTDTTGKAASVPFDGARLAAVLGVGTTLLTLTASP
jgi:stage II sporulation protein D